MGFSRQEYWSGVPLPVHGILILSTPRASLEFFALKQQNLQKVHEGVAMGSFKNA